MRNQYAWAKALHKKRSRESVLSATDAEDNEKDEENSQGAGFYDEDILTEERGKGADKVSASAVAVHRTPPTARKALGDSDAAESRRKRPPSAQHEIDKILDRVLAGRRRSS